MIREAALRSRSGRYGGPRQVMLWILGFFLQCSHWCWCREIGAEKPRSQTRARRHTSQAVSASSATITERATTICCISSPGSSGSQENRCVYEPCSSSVNSPRARACTWLRKKNSSQLTFSSRVSANL